MPKVNVPAPIAFIYNIEGDTIHHGKPGKKHDEIEVPDKLTVNVVEGLYLPDGKLQFRSDSTMPYTIRHMIRLWYALFPELEIKRVEKLVKDKKYRLAKSPEQVGQKVRSLAMTDQAVREAYGVLGRYFNVYVVGGAVRDIAGGRIPNDVDLMVQGGQLQEVESLLKALPGRTIFKGETAYTPEQYAQMSDEERAKLQARREKQRAYGVFDYKAPDGSSAEIALPRSEYSMGEGHTEFAVAADPYLSVEDDLSRRDFTANAMAVDMHTGDLIDPYNGLHDVSQGKLKMVDPQAFKDDPLRILRAFSSISRHDLKPDKETEDEMKEQAFKLRALPERRLQMELDKIFSGKDPEEAIRAMRDTGVLHYILPEVAATIDFDQKNKHHRKVLDEHLLEVLRKTAEQSGDPDLRLAALLHDIGKPASQWIDDNGKGHYYKKIELDPVTHKPTGDEKGANHEEVGAQMTHDLMTRLKYPNSRRDRVQHLVRNHMFSPFQDPKGARKFINQVGDEHANDLLMLRRSDQQGKGTDEWENQTPVSLQEQLIDRVRQEQNAVKVADLEINGNDLKQAGIQPGPMMGRILNKLLEAVLENPMLNNKPQLLEMAMNMHQMKDASLHTAANIPPAPGTTAIPPTHARLYHYTGAPEGTIDREGLRMDKAKGESYMEPNRIWASARMPDPYSHRFAEFSMAHDDPRWDIGRFSPGTNYGWPAEEAYSPEAWAKNLMDKNQDVTFHGDISPQELIAVHEPWHSHYRYLMDSTMTPDELSWLEDKAEQFPAEYRAYQEYKKNFVPPHTASILDDSKEELDPDVFMHPDAEMPKVKDKIRYFIKKTVYKVFRDQGYKHPEKWMDLVMTGSLTTYQWGNDSDFDVSVWVDKENMPDWIRAEFISIVVKYLDGVTVPGTTHPLQCYIVPPHIEMDELYRPGLRSAYDLDRGKWLVLPEKGRSHSIEKEFKPLLQYAKLVADKARLLQIYDPPGFDQFIRQLHERRHRDMSSGKDDYTQSNVAWKYLERNGLSQPLTKAKAAAIIRGDSHMADSTPKPPQKSNKEKFHTTEKEHQESLKKRGPLKTHHRHKAAVDPAWWQEFIKENPIMYHSTDPKNVDSIMRNGILPKEHTGVANYGEHNEPHLASRPDHVYIGDHGVVGDHWGPMLRVDLSKIDPSLINMDEDFPHFRRILTGALPDAIHLPKWDEHRAMATHMHHTPENAYFRKMYDTGDEPYQWPSLGQWAEENSHIIDQPEWVQASLEKQSASRRSLAIKGGVPADAISINPDELPPQDYYPLNQQWGDPEPALIPQEGKWTNTPAAVETQSTPTI